MQVAAWLKLPKTWVNLFLLYICLATLVSGLLLVRLSRNWMLANWLTNYQGGFVRRGLPGEIYYLLGKVLHITPVFFVMLSCFVLYAVFLLAARRLYLNSSFNVWVTALLLSPAFLSFQVLHPRSGFGKETIHLAALAFLAVILKKYRLSPIASSLYISSVVVYGVLAHESNVFFGFYFFAVLVIGGRTVAQAAKECVVPAALGAIALYFCSTHIGDMHVAEQICSSLGYRLNIPGSSEVCSGGAIPYLFRTREFARAETLSNITNYQYWLVFPFFSVIALIPAIGESLLLFRARIRTNLSVLWLSALFAFLASMPIFYYAYDWGRWIYIHVASIAILLIFLDGQSREAVESTIRVAASRQRFRLVVCTVFVAAYATLWILPSSIEPLRLGYVGRVLYLAHFSKKTSSEIREPIRF
jgi:hypothetical protein